jgi:hypothetical protein
MTRARTPVKRAAAARKAPVKAAAPRRRRGNVVDIRERPLEDYDATYLLCRDIRHAWAVVGYYEDAVWIRRKLECVRCETTRTDTWTPWGVRLRNQYVHPEGYRLGKGIRAQDIREEELQRVEIFKGEEELVQSLLEAKS